MAAPLLTDLTLGKYLKIVSKGAVYNNLSEDSSAWDFIKKKKKGPQEGREHRFLLKSTHGAAAVGFVPVNGGAYPTGQKASVSEGIAQYKDFALTVEVERTLIKKAMSDFSKYGEPLADELRSKTIALSRQLSAGLFKDGTGVIAQAADAGSVSSDKTVVNVANTTSARGYIGWIEPGDRVIMKNPDGTAANPTLASGTFSYYEVESVDRDAKTATLLAKASDGTTLDVDATGITAGDYMYRYISGVSTTISDLSSIGSTDYNTLSDDWVGLGSLSENDGRKVNGITLSGNLGGTRKDLDGQPLDSHAFQQIMSQLMIRVGKGRYKYKQALMAWEALDALVESREVDRRFVDLKDNKRGVEGLGYVHGKNHIMFEADEFCPEQRIYIMPDADVMQFFGSDFETVAPNGKDKFMLKPNSSGGHDRSIRTYMEGDGSIICVHAAAIGVLENYSIA